MKTVPQIHIKLSDLQQQENTNNDQKIIKEQQRLLGQVYQPKIQRKITTNSICNLKKDIIFNLLQIFRPQQRQKYQLFDDKRIVVSNAVHAIYQNNNNYKKIEYNQQKIDEISDIDIIPPLFKDRYSTPNKINQSISNNDTTNPKLTRSKSSQKRINYPRQITKYSQQQINLLRIRSGFYRFVSK